MTSLAALASKHRWWVIGGRVGFMLLAQGISSAIGGTSYKDTFRGGLTGSRHTYLSNGPTTSKAAEQPTPDKVLVRT